MGMARLLGMLIDVSIRGRWTPPRQPVEHRDGASDVARRPAWWAKRCA